MADNSEQISLLVENLSSPSRRHRQEVAHQLAAFAEKDAASMVPHADALVAALERPEAQTRWEVLGALAAVASVDPDAAAGAVEAAEDSLFDDGSSMVRLASFVFLCRYGASAPERSDEVWPLLDEAIQCYHGDAEYRDMLGGLLGLAQGKISKETGQKLAARVKFDADNGQGYIKSFSAQIISALE